MLEQDRKLDSYGFELLITHRLRQTMTRSRAKGSGRLEEVTLRPPPLALTWYDADSKLI